MLSLSIVIPSHRRVDLLRPCLDSIVRHSSRNHEIIVVDDGSPGAAVSLTALELPGVRTIRNSQPRGFCIAANSGMQAARGDVIQLLNDDTQVAAGWDEAALSCFSDPRVGAVAPLVFHGVPEDGEWRIDSAGDGYDPGGFAWKIGRTQPMAESFRIPGDVPGASASSVFLRRSTLEQVGLFPEHFGAYFEDVDLSRRLVRAGYVIRYEPASRVWHRGGSSYGRPSRRLVEGQSCNEERVFWRNLDRADRGRTIARHLAVLGAKAVRRFREGTLIPFALGRLRAFCELPFSLNKDTLPCPTPRRQPGPC